MNTRIRFPVIVAVLATLLLSGCASMLLPDWVNNPAFSLSIRLHDKEGKGYLDAQGVCNIYMRFTKEAVNKGVDDQIEVCVQARGGKGFAKVEQGVKRLNFYPLQVPHQVAQRQFEVSKTKLSPHQVLCLSECGRLGYLFEGDGYCGVIYIPTYVDRQGKEDRGTSAHEILHAFVGQFHRMGPRYSEWLPKEAWVGSSKKCT
ncbi:MAG: hypothetical protein KBC50_02420 [Candidatus Pacebacteria bacterium]|nr:hypothetical protein [Candidatus Paceibacterota bacterium]